jgi:hypothetical protein
MAVAPIDPRPEPPQRLQAAFDGLGAEMPGPRVRISTIATKPGRCVGRAGAANPRRERRLDTIEARQDFARGRRAPGR